MSEQPRKTGPRAALWGFVEGFVFAVIALTLLRLWRGGQPLQYVLMYGVAAGLICAIGRGIAGALFGAFVGGLAGLFVGGWLAPWLPQWGVPYVVEVPTPQVGQPIPLAGPTLDGKQLDVADYRGKVVLVDFWATWCGPCVHELPNVKAAYDKHHAAGFEVVGVSLDGDRDKLARFVEEKKLPWPQVFFDEPGKRGWDNPLAKGHGVDAIPATFLLDREGKIAATDLRGEELEKEVARVLEGAPAEKGEPAVRKRITIIPMTLILSMTLGALTFAVAGAYLQRRLAGLPRPATP